MLRCADCSAASAYQMQQRHCITCPACSLAAATRCLNTALDAVSHSLTTLPVPAADAAVALHYLPSVRAAAAHKAPVPPPLPGRPPPDGRVHTIGDHEESVYGEGC
jgi:hypothetical protein